MLTISNIVDSSSIITHRHPQIEFDVLAYLI